MRNAVSANDQTAFNTAADAVLRAAADYEVNSMVKPLRDWIAGYSVSKGLDKNHQGRELRGQPAHRGQ